MCIKQVIVVRKDLNMRKGKIAAQVAHASMKIILDRMLITACDDWWVERKLETQTYSPLESWLNGAFTKIVVSVDSLEELNKIEAEAKLQGVLTAKITDSGATEFNGVPTITCLAVGPEKVYTIDQITGHLNLL